MPNALAYLMLLVWPVVSVGLFRLMTVERALIWTILGGYLLLPHIANFNFPLIPALDKTSIPNVAAFLICALMLGKRVPLLPDSMTGRLLMILFVVSPVATVLTNKEPIVLAVGGLPAMRLYDAVSAVINQAIFVLPFFLARRFLNTEAAQREVLFAIVVAGLVYSLPMLAEVRLSPQINVWVYGFFAHDEFGQMMRGGGFRPMVFLNHGLVVGFFTMTTLLSVAALWRTAGPDKRALYLMALVYVFVILLLCKTIASLVYALVFAPFVLFGGGRLQVRLAAVLGLIALCYPLLRGADLVPVDFILAKAEAYDPARAQSLEFRFDNEELLLAHAGEKPLFGWGGWGRNLVYYPDSGRSMTTTDGRWIIAIGIYGWCGFLVEFGLLVLPLLLLAKRLGRLPPARVSPYVGPLSLILGINIVDLLPNAGLIPLTWLVAGALLGHAEALKAGEAKAGRLKTAVSDAAAAPGAPPEAARPRTIL